MTTFPDTRFDPQAMVVGGNVLAIRGTASGTRQTGRRFAVQQAYLLRVADGKVA